MGGCPSEDPEEFSTAVRAAYGDLFKLLRRVGSHARDLLSEFSLEPDDVQGILVGGYFSRSIDNAQAAITLAERGLRTQAGSFCEPRWSHSSVRVQIGRAHV